MSWRQRASEACVEVIAALLGLGILLAMGYALLVVAR